MGKFGWTGVDLFFVLSGYLISSQLFAGIAEGQELSFKKFFLKRFFRIIPAYLAVVAIYFCLPAAREREAPAPLWKYLTFTQNLGLDLRTQGTFSHAWSLCIEEQFYLLLPLLLIALVYIRALKKGWWLLVSLFVLGLAIRWYIYDGILAAVPDEEVNWALWYKWIYYHTYSRLDGLLCGVGIAALFQFRPLLRERLTAYGNLLLLLSLFILTAAYFVCSDQASFTASVFGFPLLSIGYGLLVMGAISPASFLYKFKSAISTKIATLSYALYLVHKIIIHLTQQQFSKIGIAADGNGMLFICIITCLAGALLINTVIEKPFLKLRDRILVKLR
jgi:peptidoglycan/LPS O-acetylase OafA/YrhL